MREREREEVRTCDSIALIGTEAWVFFEPDDNIVRGCVWRLILLQYSD